MWVSTSLSCWLYLQHNQKTHIKLFWLAIPAPLSPSEARIKHQALKAPEESGVDGPAPFSPELLRQWQTYPRQQSHFQLCLCRPKRADNFFQDSSPTDRIWEPILTLMIVGHSAESMAAERDSEHSENSAFSIFIGPKPQAKYLHWRETT